MTNKLTLSKKMILELIRFKTHAGFPFFAENGYIAKALDLTEGSVKIFVNELIKDGYLIKAYDKKGRRNLSLSDLKYTRLYADFKDVDKQVIIMERDDAIREKKYYAEQLKDEVAKNEQLINNQTDLALNNQKLTHEVLTLKEEIAKLKQQVNELDAKNKILHIRVSDLENLFYNNNISKEQLENMIAKNTQATI